MKKIMKFNEFSPEAYSSPVDWRSILGRYMLMAAIVVIPVALTVLQFLYKYHPLIVGMMAAVVAIYIPAFTLIRNPKVQVTDDFKVTVYNPTTVDTKLLMKTACTAVAYFILLVAATVLLGR